MRIKLILLVLLISISVVLGACGADSNQSKQDHTQTPEQAPTAGTPAKPTPTPTPTPTTVPNFADVDFTGKWHVTQIIDSNGEVVEESKMETLNPNFILELLKNGVYFVYDKDNEILGQGDYTIELNQLTLTAAEQQTVYEVRDKDTLWCESSDKSVTVMTRIPDETESDNEDGEDNTGSESVDDTDDVSQT